MWLRLVETVAGETGVWEVGANEFAHFLCAREVHIF
jgi:hypothetical protein